MKKRFLLVSCVILVLAAFAIPAFAAAKAKPVEIKVATPYPPPETSLASKHLVTWQKMVTDQTGGAVTFKNYYGGALGKPAEHLSLVKTGAVDMVVTYGWYTPKDLPLEDYDYTFPFGPTDPLILTKAMRQIYEEFPQFKKDFERNNAVKIFQSPGITEVFLTKNKITSLDQVKGKKCKVIGRYFGRWLEAVGISPVAAPGTEVYTMLQTGVIDMAMDTADLLYAFKIIEQAPNVLHPELLTTNWIGCWMNLNTFKKLPADVQKIVIDAGKKLEIVAASEINPAWEKMIFDNWKKTPGYSFTKMSDAERKKWADACPDTPAEWAAEVNKMGYPGDQIIKRFQELTAQMGHKWVRNWGVKQ
ncbi:MAG TPA: TRAP transporter substrate-binding protein DctP [Syntrophales bacterium]|nr:TRAP transporter substrate-binding protein DctP [Syntrophales bacterium]